MFFIMKSSVAVGLLAMMTMFSPTTSTAQSELSPTLMEITKLWENKDYDAARASLIALGDTAENQAKYWLAVLYLDGKGGPVEKDKGFALLRTAANEGHPEAGNLLGRFFLQGIGVEKNAKFLRRSS